MTHKVFRNKRGEDMIVDFWSILVFAVICIVFLVLFSTGSKAAENKLDTDFKNKDANFMLQSFLRAPAIGYDTSKTVADVIAEDDIRNDYANTRFLFNKFFQGMPYYTVKLHIEGEHKENMEHSGLSPIITQSDAGSVTTTSFGTTNANSVVDSKKGESYDAITYIPGYEGRIKLQLQVKETEKKTNEAEVRGN